MCLHVCGGYKRLCALLDQWKSFLSLRWRLTFIKMFNTAILKSPCVLEFSSFRDLGSGSSLSLCRVFYDEHWSKHRVITSLDWSPQVGPPLFSVWHRLVFSQRLRSAVPLCYLLLFASLSTPSWWLPPTTTTKMHLMNQTALLLCGTSNLKKPHQSTSFTVRYLLYLHLKAPKEDWILLILPHS